MALSPLELGETQIVEKQVMMVFVQVEVGLKQGHVFSYKPVILLAKSILYFTFHRQLTISNVAFRDHSIIDTMNACFRVPGTESAILHVHNSRRLRPRPRASVSGFLFRG